MTTKRFTIYGKEIIQDNEVWCIANSEYCADIIATAMNELNDENEQLKSDLDYFQRTYEIEERGLDIVAPMCTIGSPTPSRLELFKENEQLKERLKELEE